MSTIWPAVPSSDAARTRYLTATRFGALEGLRAFAAAAVVWNHTANPRAGYFGRGVGVTTFFVLSGFLITRMLLRERDSTGTIAVGRFYLRRTLRIFPVYYAVLALYVLLVARFERGTEAGAVFWSSLPYYLTFTTNWFVELAADGRVIFYFAWSLAVQEQFYVLWPVVLRHLRLRWAFLIPVAVLVSEDLGRLLLGLGYIDHGWVYRVLTGFDTPIFLGVLAALLLHDRRTFWLMDAVAGRSWSLPLAVALVALPAALPDVPQEVFRLCVTYLVVACVLATGPALRPLSNGLVRHVGKVSYGIYLFHMLVLNVVRRMLPGGGPGVWFALGFPATVLLAAASWRWMETPILRLRETRTAALVTDPGIPPSPSP